MQSESGYILDQGIRVAIKSIEFWDSETDENASEDLLVESVNLRTLYKCHFLQHALEERQPIHYLYVPGQHGIKWD